MLYFNWRSERMNGSFVSRDGVLAHFGTSRVESVCQLVSGPDTSGLLGTQIVHVKCVDCFCFDFHECQYVYFVNDVGFVVSISI